VDAYYAYDSGGTRARQVLVKNGGTIVEQRVYAGAFERYTRTVNGAVTLARETVHVLDLNARVAIVETDVTPGAPAAQPVRRFQLADQLGSVGDRAERAGHAISVEEYSPFGSTTYQAGPNSGLGASSAIATRAASATRRPASPTTRRATTRLGWAGGQVAIPRASARG